MQSNQDFRIANTRTSLRGLRTFCIAAKHENFSQAAEELFVTASAVSHQIKNLEAELDQRLFERDGRALKLSAAGRAIFEETCPLITELDEVLARYGKRRARRTLRLSVQPFFASELLIPKLDEFILQHPELELTVDTSNETSEHLPPQADVGIRLFRSPPPGAARLLPLSLVPVGSPEFREALLVRNKVIKSSFPLIVHQTRASAWQQWSRESGIRLPDNSQTIRLGSMIAVVRAAQRGLGAALVPSSLSKPWIESGQLALLFHQRLKSDDAYYVISSDDKADDVDVRAFRDWVLQEFDGEE